MTVPQVIRRTESDDDHDDDEDEGEDVDEEEIEFEVCKRRSERRRKYFKKGEEKENEEEGNLKVAKTEKAGKSEIPGKEEKRENIPYVWPDFIISTTDDNIATKISKGQKAQVSSHNQAPAHTHTQFHIKAPSHTHTQFHAASHTHTQASTHTHTHAPSNSHTQVPTTTPAAVADATTVSALTPVPAHAPARAPPGLDGVVAAQTRLSLVDGLNGVLVIGGYPIEEIAGRLSLEEAALLLWTGNLPSAAKVRAMRKELAGCCSLRSETLEIIRTAQHAPPIDALRMACATLSLGLPHPDNITPADDLALAKRLLGSFPTVVAAHSRLRRGLEPIAPRADLGLAANFLYMTFGVEPDPRAVKALETYWVSVCDHGMNASTFTARVIASTRSDMVSAVTGAVGALKGPLHGGAPGPVLDMLVEMKTVDAAEAWLRREMGEGRRIMGFGHRIYKVRDPRAEVLAKAAKEMAGANLQNGGLYTLALAVEKIALRVLEELKPGRNLKTNVEFYTALVLQSLGLEPDQFVALFACGRVVGWCAHVMEQHQQDRLLRPQSQYIGPRKSWSKQKEEEGEDDQE